MQRDPKLMQMLVEYASSHQHPFNIAVHLVGIPTIMLGMSVVLSWVGAEIAGTTINLAYVVVLALFSFYLTLDKIFSVFFLLYAAPIAWFGTKIGAEPLAVSGTVAAATFFGGYAAQFAGHAIEKSVPVVLKHPMQAHLAAPFFTIVEIFKLAGLREALFNDVQQRISNSGRERAA